MKPNALEMIKTLKGKNLEEAIQKMDDFTIQELKALLFDLIQEYRLNVKPKENHTYSLTIDQVYTEKSAISWMTSFLKSHFGLDQAQAKSLINSMVINPKRINLFKTKNYVLPEIYEQAKDKGLKIQYKIT